MVIFKSLRFLIVTLAVAASAAPRIAGAGNARVSRIPAPGGEVKSEFMKPPYSTWTAICVDRHYCDTTVVEIKVTAFAPKASKGR